MTESEFLASENPQAMLHQVLLPGPLHPRRISSRKLQLFCSGCHRLRWPDQPQKSAAYEDAAESVWKCISPSRWAMDWAEDRLPDPPKAAMAVLLREIVGNPFRPVALCGRQRKPFHSQYAHVDPNGGFWIEHECQGCARIRTPIVLGIAHSIYEERTFGDMPVLADALEDAGCDDAEILGHCRGEEVCYWCEAHGYNQSDLFCPVENRRGTGRTKLRGPHVRGCWALDLILGEE